MWKLMLREVNKARDAIDTLVLIFWMSHAKDLVAFIFGINCYELESYPYSAAIHFGGVTEVTSDLAILQSSLRLCKVPLLSQKTSDEDEVTNDLTFLKTSLRLCKSPLFNDLKDGKAPEVSFVANDVTCKWGYYLTDEIHPELSVLIMSISQPDLNDTKRIRVWKSVRYGVSKELDTAYWGFLGVGTTLDIFQNIIFIPYLEYGVLSLSGYGVLSFILYGLWLRCKGVTKQIVGVEFLRGLALKTTGCSSDLHSNDESGKGFKWEVNYRKNYSSNDILKSISSLLRELTVGSYESAALDYNVSLKTIAGNSVSTDLRVWKSVRYSVSKELDIAYWGFLGVGTTLDIFQNIIFIPYLEYGVLSLSGYGVVSFILCGLW
ncbi:ALP1-like protein isoform X1 [Tanacetum coccineum]